MTGLAFSQPTWSRDSNNSFANALWGIWGHKERSQSRDLCYNKVMSNLMKNVLSQRKSILEVIITIEDLITYVQVLLEAIKSTNYDLVKKTF